MSETEATSTQRPRKKRGCVAQRVTPLWADFAIVAFAVLLLFMVLPNYIRLNGHSKEGTVKDNLHRIQSAVERFAVDTGGTYPQYLIGGEGKHSTYVENSASAFTNVQDCYDEVLLADPLLRMGYLQAYPRNPFVYSKDAGAFIHRFQEDVADPLRNGTEDAKLHGTRFGPYCTLMGSVIADKRYPGTYADFGYPFYDTYEKGNNKPRPFLPGEFFYRSRSVPVVADAENGERQVTHVVQDYMLGGYGSIRTKGRDVFGPDITSENEVSPFSPEGEYGNPNGIRDSIILVLTPEDDR